MHAKKFIISLKSKITIKLQIFWNFTTYLWFYNPYSIRSERVLKSCCYCLQFFMATVTVKLSNGRN